MRNSSSGLAGLINVRNVIGNTRTLGPNIETKDPTTEQMSASHALNESDKVGHYRELQ